MIKIDTRDVSVTGVCEAVIAKQDNLAAVVFNMPGQIFSLVRTWRERAASRAGLRYLAARLLDDVGLSRKQANEETNKPFWI